MFEQTSLPKGATFLKSQQNWPAETHAQSGSRISVGAAAAYTGLAESTLAKLRMTGSGPRFLKISARRVAYDTRDIDEWLATKRRVSTSDTGSTERAA
jgi:predicted DNA-binding transcriptional regulator AlpA